MTERAPDKWDIKAAQVHGEPNDAPEVIISGIHLTFANVCGLTVMFVAAQAVLGTVVALVLYLLGVI